MSIHRSHWYLVGVSFYVSGQNPIPQSYSVFIPTTEKSENINQAMVIQFQDFSKDWIEKNNNISISSINISGLSYLGHMSNEEFYAK